MQLRNSSRPGLTALSVGQRCQHRAAGRGAVAGLAAGGGGGAGSARPLASPAVRAESRSTDKPAPTLESRLDELLQAAQTTATRLRRQLQPPPAGFPPGPNGEAAVQLLQQPLGFLEQLRRQHGTVVGLLLGGERVVLVAEPAAARTVLIDNQELFVKSGTAFFPGSSLAGNGLLVSDGEVWRRQRRLANPAFRRTAVDKYAEAMVASTDRMLRASWRSGAVRDVYPDFNRLTLRITLEALFGAQLAREVAGLEITDAIQDAFRFFAQRGAAAMAIPEFVPTPDNLRFTGAVARLDKAVFALIGERRRELAAAPRPAADLLDSLLMSADEAGEGMSDRALRDELMTLLVAGQETSAILLAWTCAYLAHNPQAQAAAAAEVAARLEASNGGSSNGGSGGSGRRGLQAADARKLPYVEAVVLEAMRLSPPAYLVGRCASQATSLAGYSLPQGTTVLVSPYLLHRDPAWWGPDAATFRPERWLELQQQRQQQGGTTASSSSSSGGSSAASSSAASSSAASSSATSSSATSSSPPASSSASGSSGGGGGGGMAFLQNLGPNGAYLPFGAGQRNCIGSGFAIMEAVLVVAQILQQYQLKPLPGTAFPQPQPQITLRPDRVRLLLRKR